MDKYLVYEAIKVAFFIILGGITLYYRTSTKLNETATNLISDAEDMFKDTTNAGGKRFEWVVDQLYTIVPKILKPFITRTVVENLVQSAFDIIKNYAKKELDNVVNKLSVNDGDGK